jgi:hypothetical protein
MNHIPSLKFSGSWWSDRSNMKSLTDSFLIWWLRRGRYSWSKLRRWLFERRYLGTALPVANSLEDVETCLAQVTWTMDGFFHAYDAISYPQTVWAKKKDDCDGFAVLAATLLRQRQSDCRPVLITAMLRPVSNSHTVCGFRATGDVLWFFDNSQLRRVNAQNYGDIVDLVKGRDRLVCWDVRDPGTFDLIEFNVL